MEFVEGGHMLRRWKFLAGMLTIGALLLANLSVAQHANAHFGPYHLNHGGEIVYPSVRNGTTSVVWNAAANALDHHDNRLNLSWVYWDDHAPGLELSVFDFNEGNANNCGGFYPEGTSGHHITHGHAWYNTGCNTGWYDWVLAVYCQEIGHGWGQEHHHYGDSCMGAGYDDAPWMPWLSDHDWSDFYGQYRWH